MHPMEDHSEKQAHAAERESRSDKGRDKHARVNQLLAAAADILADTIVPHQHQLNPKGKCPASSWDCIEHIASTTQMWLQATVAAGSQYIVTDVIPQCFCSNHSSNRIICIQFAYANPSISDTTRSDA